MPDWINLSSALSLLRSVNLPIVLAGLVIFASLLVYFDSFCRAMEPRAGTLEWIRMYDRPAFSLSGRRFSPGSGDYLPLVLFSSATAGLCAFGIVRICQSASIALADVLLSPDALLTGTGGYALFAGVSLLPCYFLLQAVFGRRAIAAGGTAVFALTLAPSGAAASFSVPCLLLSSLLLFRYATADADARFRTLLPSLAGAVVLFWLAVWADHIALWFGIGSAALLLVALFLHLRNRRLPGIGVMAALTLVTVAALSALCVVLINLPAALLEREMAFPLLLTQRQFWRFLLVRTLSFRIWIDPLGLLAVSLLQPLLWWGGLLAMLVTVAALFARRDASALFVWVFYLAGMLVWIFVGSGLGALAGVLTLSYVWNGFLSRGRSAAAYGYCIACLVLSVALPALLLLLS